MSSKRKKAVSLLPMILMIVGFSLYLIIIIHSLTSNPKSMEEFSLVPSQETGNTYISNDDGNNSAVEAGVDINSDIVSDIEYLESEEESIPNENIVCKDYIFDIKGDISRISKSSLENLENVIKTQADRISIYYENHETGLTITYRPDEVYTSASVVKAPFVKEVLTRNIDLSEVITSKYSVHEFPVGKKFTVDELIYYTLVYSDDHSYFELMDRFGKEGFNKLSEELGVTCRVEAGHFCEMTANETAVYFKDLYKYEAEEENGKYMLNYLRNIDHYLGVGKALAERYPVAQKYGANYRYIGFHNCAIVYAPSPYILNILTDLYPKKENTPIFKEVSLAIDEINSQVACETIKDVSGITNK